MKTTRWVMAAVVIAGCGPDLQGDVTQDGADVLATTTDDLATTVIVKIIGHQFVPSSVTIKKGTSVKFVNTSTGAHTVTSGTGSSAAGAGSRFVKVLAPGKSTTVKFTTVGAQAYFCRPHEAMGMNGVVSVTP